MKSLTAFFDHAHPDALTPEQRQRVSETCNTAMACADAYLAKHAEAIIDRGCEGTLISYQTVMPIFIEHIRGVFVAVRPNAHTFSPSSMHRHRRSRAITDQSDAGICDA